jgi:hypothetical protein
MKIISPTLSGWGGFRHFIYLHTQSVSVLKDTPVLKPSHAWRGPRAQKSVRVIILFHSLIRSS